MPPAPCLVNETERLAAVALIFGRPPERQPWADELCRAAAALTGCPVALLTVLDRDRQYFVGSVGWNESSTERDCSLCGWTIHQDQTLVIGDALADARASDDLPPRTRSGPSDSLGPGSRRIWACRGSVIRPRRS